jgi:hypothetical protein
VCVCVCVCVCVLIMVGYEVRIKGLPDICYV